MSVDKNKLMEMAAKAASEGDAKKTQQILELVRAQRNVAMAQNSHGVGGQPVAGGYVPPGNAAGMWGGPPATYPVLGQPMPAGVWPRQYSLEEKLSMRMNWTYWAPGFEHSNVHAAGEKVMVWIITKDYQSVVIEDGIELYPSDTLITKLRMLEQGKSE